MNMMISQKTRLRLAENARGRSRIIEVDAWRRVVVSGIRWTSCMRWLWKRMGKQLLQLTKQSTGLVEINGSSKPMFLKEIRDLLCNRYVNEIVAFDKNGFRRVVSSSMMFSNPPATSPDVQTNMQSSSPQMMSPPNPNGSSPSMSLNSSATAETRTAAGSSRYLSALNMC